MKTVNQIILVLDAILGVTLLAFGIAAKLPSYCMLVAVFAISFATGMLMPILFIESENKKKKKFFTIGAIALYVFVVMTYIANYFVIPNTVIIVITSVFCTLSISIALYNIERIAKKDKNKS